MINFAAREASSRGPEHDPPLLPARDGPHLVRARTGSPTWLEVEIAATEVLAERGIVPPEALAAIKEKARFDVARIDAIEKEVQHDVIAFVSNVAENVGPEGRWLHYGLTSSDVVDTALALLMRDACDLILPGRGRAAWTRSRSARFEHKHTPMIGRTHGVHAEPMTFGLKLALWYAELARDRARLERARETIAVGKLSGAVGTFSHLPPEVEEAVCARLGLTPAPIASQVLQRDRHAEVMTDAGHPGAPAWRSSPPRSAPCRRRRCARWRSRSARGRRARSAMPHKRNPVGCEQVTGLARLVRANALAALENVALWHERDISHSSVERVIVPDSFLALDHMLRRFTDIVRGHDRERRAHAAEPRLRRAGLVFSGQLLLELTARGHAPRGRLPRRAGARHGGLADGGRLPRARVRRPRGARGR